MARLVVRVSDELKRLLMEVAGRFDVTVSELVRKALSDYFAGGVRSVNGRLRRLSLEVKILELAGRLRELERVQRVMLKSGAFLDKELPRDVPRIERWAMVSGVEREALECLLAERERVAKELAMLVKRAYRGRKRVVLTDKPPYILLDEG